MSIGLGVRRLAAVVAALAFLGALAVPLAPLGLWWEFSLVVKMSPEELSALGRHELAAAFELARRWIVVEDPRDVTRAALVVSGLIAVVATVPTTVALASAGRALAECAAGRPFSPTAARCFRRFAWAVLAAAVAGVAAPTLSAQAAAVLSPAIPDTGALRVGFGDVRGVFSGLLLVVVAHMLAAARRLADDAEAIL